MVLNLDILRDIMPPLTIGEIENTRKLEKASKTFSDSVDKLIRLEAMLAENKLRESRGEAPKYGEEEILKLLQDGAHNLHG